MDLLSELETIRADYSAAHALLEEAKLSQDTLKADIADKDNALSEAGKAIEGLNASLASKDSSIAELKASLAALEAKQKTAEEKAIEIVASQGIAPMKVDNSASEVMTKDSAFAELMTIEDPVARGAFYFANKETLFGK